MLKKVILLIILITQITKLTPAQTASQDAENLPKRSTSQPAAIPVIKQRIGIDGAQPYALTMQAAIELAMENNRDIEVERIAIQRSEFELAAAKGIFDPSMAMDFSYGRRITPVASILAGGINGKLTSSSLSSSSSLTQRLPWQGGDLKLTLENNRLKSDNLFNALSTEYRSSLYLEYSQPLMRNRTIDNSRRQIKVKSRQLALSDQQFRQRVIEIIAQVQSAYWDLAFAYRNEEIRRESVSLAQTQLEQNRRLMEQGIMASSDLISSQVEIERRIDEAEAAVDAVQRAENRLKALMLQPSQTELWSTMLWPVDQPTTAAPQIMSLTEALTVAFQQRPEMAQYQLRGDINKVNIEYQRNQLKPEINLIAGYGTTGLSGTERDVANPIASINQPYFDRINQLSQLANLPLIQNAFNDRVSDQFIGGYGQNLSNLFGNKYRNWQVGININFSLRNRTAKAQLGQALAEDRQLDVERQRAQQAIEVEVRNALQTVNTAYRRVEAATKSRINAELQHQAEARKFSAGISTNFLMLDRQNALSAAQGREVKALTDYNKALIELQRAMSLTTQTSNIVISKR